MGAGRLCIAPFHVDTRIRIKKGLRVRRQEHHRRLRASFEYIGAGHYVAGFATLGKVGAAEHRRLVNLQLIVMCTALCRNRTAYFTTGIGLLFKIDCKRLAIKTRSWERHLFFNTRLSACQNRLFHIAVRRRIRITPALMFIVTPTFAKR